mgnify:CR=1 FL=1
MVGTAGGDALRRTEHALSLLRAAPAPAVVNLASTRALQSEPHTEAYAACKGGIVALTKGMAVDAQPRFSPDGKRIAFVSDRRGAPNLWRLPLDGSAPQPVTDFKSGRIFNFAWSADGKTLYIVRGNVNSDLILIRDSGNSTNR